MNVCSPRRQNPHRERRLSVASEPRTSSLGKISPRGLYGYQGGFFAPARLIFRVFVYEHWKSKGPWSGAEATAAWIGRLRATCEEYRYIGRAPVDVWSFARERESRTTLFNPLASFPSSAPVGKYLEDKESKEFRAELLTS
ncbi:hypothetical protein CFIO01_07409 [Colletotrichum fioriniae PJ7]|uniref:Uncharacterized protein n=1 Tax=Colletotrichum fioriniae PJ7 TaxID=1445577 RepID=A0A010R3L8_9PEZI|nr:hypothetical protein CFIO01_07409 [Colletotrichum fioriniae PJ7]